MLVSTVWKSSRVTGYIIFQMHIIVSKSAAARQTIKADYAKNAKKTLKKYSNMVDIAKFFIGLLISQAPGLSFYALQPVLARYQTALVANFAGDDHCTEDELLDAANAARSEKL